MSHVLQFSSLHTVHCTYLTDTCTCTNIDKHGQDGVAVSKQARWPVAKYYIPAVSYEDLQGYFAEC